MIISQIWFKFKDYKENHGCLDCNISHPHYVLEFDHRDSSKKIDNVYRVLKKFGEDAAWNEVKKCDVVCANCHKERSFRRMNNEEES